MRRKILIAAIVILLIAGLGFLLFPTISNRIGKMNTDKLSRQFDDTRNNIIDTIEEDGQRTDNADDAYQLGLIDKDGYRLDKKNKRTSEFPVVFQKDLERLRQDSMAYNRGLVGRQGAGDTIHYEYAVFDMREYGVADGMYACLTIPKIDLRLPVYLGADSNTMSYGVGHLYGTSLPLNEKNTNCALAGHTDYIGRIFFDNIRKLDIGDEVIVRNYWENITYRVAERKIVADNEVDDLLIKKDQQLLTLITCIKGEDGFDRYLVICKKG